MPLLWQLRQARQSLRPLRLLLLWLRLLLRLHLLPRPRLQRWPRLRPSLKLRLRLLLRLLLWLPLALRRSSGTGLMAMLLVIT